jgi:hypothetical protein
VVNNDVGKFKRIREDVIEAVSAAVAKSEERLFEHDAHQTP